MFTIFILLVISIKIQDNDASVPSKDARRVDNFMEKNNRDQLAKFVEYLNDDTENQEQKLDERDEEDDKEKFKLEDVMKLLQKNYDAETEKKNKIPNVRLHVIKNPKVLEQYLNDLRRKHSSSTSDESSDSDYDRKTNDHADVRRNAEFRLIKDSNEIDDVKLPKLKVKTTKGSDISMEGQITPFKIRTHDGSSKRERRGKDPKIRDRSRDFKRFEQAMYRDETADDTWDIITKKFDWKSEKENDFDGDQSKTKTKKNRWSDDEYTTKRAKKRLPRPEWKKKMRDDEFVKKRITNQLELDDTTLKVRNDWDDPKPKKKYFNTDWDTPKTNKEPSNNWDSVGKWRDTEKSSRNTWRQVERKKKAEHSFKPRLPERGAGREREGGFQGRTPIPFVGRQGIYEDK